MNLVIVESPAKASTIKGYLGNGYKVLASKGHVRDLPKSTLGVDIDNNFQPKYINIRGKADLINELKKEAKGASIVYFATDPDREGEAISWHLATVLGLDEKKARRVTFNEINKNAVKAAIKNPSSIDMNLVNSQQTRRILDRIVGYKLSPLLWKKVKNGLSAGRVQSVATKLIVERENEIRAFKSEEYWTLAAMLTGEAKKKFKANFYGDSSKKISVSNKEEMDAILENLEGATYTVKTLKKGVKVKTPAAPFTTSSLQQEAYKKLGFLSTRTMKVAQELYEGINLGKKGDHGLITYMRTDSMRVSGEAQAAAKELIIEKYGEEYIPNKPRVYKTKKNAQDAHEAIRPSDVKLLPESIKSYLTGDQFKLYKLIWDRFIASQMASADINTVNAEILASGKKDYIFKANGHSVKFSGYMAVYEETSDDNEDNEGNGMLPKLTEGEELSLKSLSPEQNFTQPPTRYTDSSFVKVLEEKGIGRPSTYTPTLSLILSRGYVERSGKFLKPTPLGEVTTEIMEKNFGPIIDYKFTANMEENLDDIETGKSESLKILSDFYAEFAELLKKADETMKQEKVVIPQQELDMNCPKCGAKMVLKHGRFGKFAACPNYPDCKTTMPVDKTGKPVEPKEDVVVPDMKCELCGGKVLLKKGRYGEFYACEHYPKCKYTKQQAKEIGVKCPKCGGNIIVKKGKKRTFYGCDNYPKCDFSTWDMPVNEKCPECGGILLKKKGKAQHYCMNEKCGYKVDVKEDKE